MNRFEIGFTTPWMLLLFIPVLFITLFPYFRLPKIRRRTLKKWLPTVLRTITGILLVLILAGISLVHHTSEQSVVILMDLSDSTEPVQVTIREHGEQLAALTDSETPLAVVAFANGQANLLEMDAENRQWKEAAPLSTSTAATDISGALEYAATLLPDGRGKKIILLTDGKETDGDAVMTARQLASAGIRIDALCYATDVSDPEVQLSAFSADTGIYLGKTITFTAEIESNRDTTVSLSLYDGEDLLQSESYPVAIGDNAITIAIPAEKAGKHIYRLSLSAANDWFIGNNEMSCAVDVIGQPTVLLLTDYPDRAGPLASILSEVCQLDVLKSLNAPASVVELGKYDEVILCNVDADYLPRNYGDVLESYVRDYGRSLFTVGGSWTYMFGNMSNTTYEDLMPVSFQLNRREEGKEVALMLVVDSSLSMSQLSHNLPIAKQGAIKCVESLRENDTVGVISFNSKAKLESPLLPATDANKAALSRTISSISTSHGTYYAEALRLAKRELDQSNAPIKHVMFLSDGQPGDSGYSEAAQAMHMAGITLSTIGIGFNSSTLFDLAYLGGGRYYYVQDVKDLPEIMLSESNQATVSSLVKKDFTPIVNRIGAVTEGLEKIELPKLTGYLATSIKNGAEAYLLSDEGHPIYAGWRYGKGQVVSFMSDLCGEWSEKWLTSEVGQMLITRMLQSSVPTEHIPSMLIVRTEQQGSSTQILVETTGELNKETLAVQYESSDGSRNGTVVLSPSKPGIYTGVLPIDVPGVYAMSVIQTNGKEEVVDFLRTDLVISYPKEYNCFMTGGEALVQAVTDATGGITLGSDGDDYRTLAATSVGDISFAESLMLPFGILAVLLFLADYAVRKLRWKDIRALFPKKS